MKTKHTLEQLMTRLVETTQAIAEYHLTSVDDPWRPYPYHESVKRALVVAAVSRRTIAVIGPPENYLAPILAGGSRLGAVPCHHWPCPCGHLGDPRLQCVCTPTAVLRWQKRIPPVDLVVVASSVPARDLSSTHLGSSTIDAATRVESARTLRPSISSALDEQSTRLMYCAQTELGVTAERRAGFIQIAADIAALDGSTVIRCEHVAESIQYRLRLGC